MGTKSEQLQIRVTPAQKIAIQRRASKSRLDVSTWVLKTLLPEHGDRFQEILRATSDSKFMFAQMADFLNGLSPQSFSEAVSVAPRTSLSEEDQNYLAATIEYLSKKKRVPAPDWLEEITPLAEPWFASDLLSLRLHLLLNSPPPFRKRNLFVDSTAGDRL